MIEVILNREAILLLNTMNASLNTYSDNGFTIKIIGIHLEFTYMKDVHINNIKIPMNIIDKNSHIHLHVLCPSCK